MKYLQKILFYFIFVTLLPVAVALSGSFSLRYDILEQGETAKFLLETNQKDGIKVFQLYTPDRIVIDLAHNDPNNLPPPLVLTPEENGFIKNIRTGIKDGNTLRLVLDLHHTYPLLSKKITPSKRDGYYELALQLGPQGEKPSALTTLKPKQPPIKKASSSPKSNIPIPTFKPKPKPIIVIDAGHGGQDPGAIGRAGTREKNITLAYAKELQKKLLNTGRYRAVLTRNYDTFLLLHERVKRARKAKGDLFISFHADSHPKSKTSGLSVYTVSEKASDREAAALARKENKADLVVNVNFKNETREVSNILLDLIQRDTLNNSARFAETLISTLSNRITLLRNTHRYAGFKVLKAPDIPSVLVELGYLSNRREEKRLKTKAYREKVLSGVVKAIDLHFRNQ